MRSQAKSSPQMQRTAKTCSQRSGERDATVWLFGGEGQGLTADTLLAANRRLRIPIDSRVESLNVGAAAAVCLFEQKRRRGYRALS